jgi:hypothetical protein
MRMVGFSFDPIADAIAAIALLAALVDRWRHIEKKEALDVSER